MKTNIKLRSGQIIMVERYGQPKGFLHYMKRLINIFFDVDKKDTLAIQRSVRENW